MQLQQGIPDVMHLIIFAGSDAANLSKGLKLPSIVKTWNDVLIDTVRNASALVDAGVAPFNGVNIPPARARMAAILNTCM